MTKLCYINNPFSNATDFASLGIQKLTLLTQWALFAGNNYSQIDMDTVRRVASHPTWWKGQESMPIVFDIETMALASNDEPRRDHEHDQLIELIEHYRNHPWHHHKALGLYSEMPVRDFHRANKGPGHPHYEQWKKENRNYLFNLHNTTLERQRGLSAFVDRVYPSLYYWYPDRLPEFKPHADRQLHEAAIYNKPIIAYVSPQVQTSGFPFWKEGVWREMLRFVYEHPLVDGVVIYLAKVGDAWNDDWPWWKETLEVHGA